ncbi:MAG: hypothetical protein KUG76_04975 [Gammaproteobacteria bacterium]|nr:hypothetical protein [Gammaproteobacteria bacterium]
MSKILILQSHQQPLPKDWLTPCVNSVKNWAQLKGYEYQFLNDAFFDILPTWVIEKTQSQIVIATDLARLRWIQRYLNAGYDCVVWMDADFLIFSAHTFDIEALRQAPEGYALGREIWIQPKDLDNPRPTQFKAYKKVHNAFLQFQKGNYFLDFYASHAERLLAKNRGPIPPQFIGPKLLTALHNIVQCPVQENAGMLSPWLIKDKLNNEGPALSLYRKENHHPLAAANLCSSLIDNEILHDKDIKTLIEQLLETNIF